MTALQVENFVLGSFKGRYRLLKSPRVDEITSVESMDFLRQLGGHIESPVTMATLLCKDKLFAVSFIRPDKDEIGRKTVWNHTILIPCDALVEVLKTLVPETVFIKEPNGALTAPLPKILFETDRP